MIALNIPEVFPMTAIITDCRSTIETRLVDQSTGDTVRTAYHEDVETAVQYVEQFNPDRVEFDTL